MLVCFPDADQNERDDKQLKNQPDSAEPDLIETSSEDSADESAPDHELVERAEEQVIGPLGWWRGTSSCYLRVQCIIDMLCHELSIFWRTRAVPGLCVVERLNVVTLLFLLGPVTMLPLCKQCFNKFKRV